MAHKQLVAIRIRNCNKISIFGNKNMTTIELKNQIEYYRRQ